MIENYKFAKHVLYVIAGLTLMVDFRMLIAPQLLSYDIVLRQLPQSYAKDALSVSLVMVFYTLIYVLWCFRCRRDVPISSPVFNNVALTAMSLSTLSLATLALMSSTHYSIQSSVDSDTGIAI